VSVITVKLPAHLTTLARVSGEVRIEVPHERPSPAAVLDALEARYPMLLGTIREHDRGPRRAFIRFFACGADLSHEPIDAPLLAAVISGEEPFLIVGAIAGG
jgi:hypothetical protein